MNGACAAKNSAVRAMSAGVPMRLRMVRSMILLALRRVALAFGPQHRARRDAVDAHLGAQLLGERARQHVQPGLGRAVHGVVTQRPQGVDVDDVEDQSA